MAKIDDNFYFLMVVTKTKALYISVSPGSDNYYSNIVVSKKRGDPLD